MASLVIIVHESVGQREELDAGGPLVTIAGGDVGEEMFGVLLEAVGNDVVVTSGVVMPVAVERGWRPIISAWVVATGTVVF